MDEELMRRVKELETALTGPQQDEQERAATDRAAALLAPLEAKARALRAERDAKLRVAVLREAADRINALPQDYELDPGRGDSADLLRRMATEAPSPEATD